MAQAWGVVVNSRVRVGAGFLRQAHKLKWVLSMTSGLDHIDHQACQKHGVGVLSTPQAGVQSVAELSIMLMLEALRKRLRSLEACNRALGKFHIERGVELLPRTVGLWGVGRIGGRVGSMLSAWGLEVLGFDPYKDEEHFAKHGVKSAAWRELLMRAEVLSLHVPLTHETKQGLNAAALKLMPQGAVVVNTARGAVVVEQDMRAALQSHLGGYAFDVTTCEPFGPGHGFYGVDKVIPSPHVGAHTKEAFARASFTAAELLISKKA